MQPDLNRVQKKVRLARVETKPRIFVQARPNNHCKAGQGTAIVDSTGKGADCWHYCSREYPNRRGGRVGLQEKNARRKAHTPPDCKERMQKYHQKNEYLKGRRDSAADTICIKPNKAPFFVDGRAAAQEYGNCGTWLCYLNRRKERTNLHHANNTKNAHGDKTYTNMSLHTQSWYFALTVVVTGGDGAKPTTEGSGVTTGEGPSASGDSPGPLGCESVEEDGVSLTPEAGPPKHKGRRYDETPSLLKRLSSGSS